MSAQPRDRWGLALIAAAAALLPPAVLMAFYYAPRELSMGEVQRIFYFHVPAAWVGFLGFFVTFAASIAYLVRGERRWDMLASSAAEVGLTFITAAVISGSLWARPVWGTYWTWEPRLTISAVQLLVYVSYVMLRSAADNPAQTARFSAVYGIIAFITVPLSWFAIRWWRSIHPDVLTGGEGSGLESRMVQTLMFCLLTFTVLYFAILRQRVRLEFARDRLAVLRESEDLDLG